MPSLSIAKIRLRNPRDSSSPVEMIPCVLRTIREQVKILWGIVKFITVYVMDNFTLLKNPTKAFFGNKHVLSDISILRRVRVVSFSNKFVSIAKTYATFPCSAFAALRSFSHKFISSFCPHSFGSLAKCIYFLFGFSVFRVVSSIFVSTFTTTKNSTLGVDLRRRAFNILRAIKARKDFATPLRYAKAFPRAVNAMWPPFETTTTCFATLKHDHNISYSPA